MFRCLLALLLVALSGLLAAGWTSRMQSASRQGKVIRFAYVGSQEDARHLTAVRFKQQVERDTAGSVRVELYSGGQLGGDRDAIEGLPLGTIEMTVAGAGIFANFEPAVGVTALPFLFDDFDEAWAFLDGPVGEEIERRLLARGWRVLAWWDNGFRCVTNSVRPVQTPRDLQGLTIRTPENPIVLATMRALGASPSPLPWPELYMALQQRAFDGQENPIPLIYLNKLYEVQKYLSLTNHVYEPMPLVVGERFWQRLTKVEQQALVEAARESQQFNRQLVRRQAAEMLQNLQAVGLSISQPNLEPFQQATRRTWTEQAGSIGPELVEAAIRFVQEWRVENVRARSERAETEAAELHSDGTRGRRDAATRGVAVGRGGTELGGSALPRQRGDGP